MNVSPARRPGSWRRAARTIPYVLVTLGLGACGSGTTSYGSGGGASSSTTPLPAQSAGSQTISTSQGPLGTYLTDGSGRTVYLWEGDSSGTSKCIGACANVWPPVTTTGAPLASGGAMATDLGTLKRSDGSTQVTYGGHPLYYFIKDSGAGPANGQGSNGFGAKWWMVKPTGSALIGSHSTPAPTSASGSASSSSGGGY